MLRNMGLAAALTVLACGASSAEAARDGGTIQGRVVSVQPNKGGELVTVAAHHQGKGAGASTRSFEVSGRTHIVGGKLRPGEQITAHVRGNHAVSVKIKHHKHHHHKNRASAQQNRGNTQQARHNARHTRRAR